MRRVSLAAPIVGILLATAGCSSSGTGHGPHPPAGSAIAITSARRPTLATVRDCVTDHLATWMGCLVRADPDFGRFPLSGLALPGARNAGAYNLDPESFDTQRGSPCTSFTPRDATLGPEFARWSQTQDETITEQLDQGIRFVDLQVAYNGNGSTQTGWRVVESQYSDFPLYDYLDQIAIWAKAHPSEAVVVDLSRVCYDNGARGPLADGLWTAFSTPSNVEASRVTMAKVAYDPGPVGVPIADSTIDEIAKPGHNVVILVPEKAVDVSLLTTKYHVHPVTVEPAHSGAAPSSPTKVEVEPAVARVAPLSISGFAAADAHLEDFPLSTRPALGTTVGKGLFVAQLAYSLTKAARAALFQRFGGLITSASVSLRNHHTRLLSAWEARLWSGNAPRDGILAVWGHRANVVLADGVEYGRFIEVVIGLNAR